VLPISKPEILTCLFFYFFLQNDPLPVDQLLQEGNVGLVIYFSMMT